MTRHIHLAVGEALALAIVLCTAPSAMAGTNTVTYSTAGEHQFVVPAGVTSMSVVAVGARGGTGYYHVRGGRGAKVSANLAVTPGAVRYVVVGGPGMDSSHVYSAGSGGGGGASDIRTQPLSAGISPSDPRVLIAAGGGGAGRGTGTGDAGTAGYGGDGGMPGGASRNCGAGCEWSMGGGQAGVPTGTGAGGIATEPPNGAGDGQNGAAGSLGLGGAGAFVTDDEQQLSLGGFNGGGLGGGWAGFGHVTYGGGGGGGGLNGGGGGAGYNSQWPAAGGGGGGGSNLVPAGGSATIDENGPARVSVSWTDTTPPTPTIDDMPARRNFTYITGKLGTVLGDGKQVFVDIYAGPTATGTPYGTYQGGGSGSTWSANLLWSLPDGQYTARARQIDGAGNVGTTGSETFLIENVLPELSVTSPANGAAINDATPEIKGVAGTAEGDLAKVDVTIRVSGALETLQSATGQRDATTGAFSIPIPAALPDGAYYAYVAQYDAAGNGNAKGVDFTIDTTAPGLTVTTAPDATTTDATPSFAGAGGTAAGDASTVQLVVHSGSEASGTPVATAESSLDAEHKYALDVASPLADGTYTARVSQADVAGNTAAETRTFTVASPATGTTAPGTTPTPTAPGSLPGAGGTAARDLLAPVLSRTSLSKRRIRGRRSTLVRYTLSENATLAIVVRRKGKTKRIGNVIRRKSVKGANRLRLGTRLGGKRLAAGRYILTLVAVDAAENPSKAVRLALRIG